MKEREDLLLMTQQFQRATPDIKDYTQDCSTCPDYNLEITIWIKVSALLRKGLTSCWMVCRRRRSLKRSQSAGISEVAGDGEVEWPATTGPSSAAAVLFGIFRCLDQSGWNRLFHL
jgi:hypothetical protein